MKKDTTISRSHERWARFRFSVIGSLLAAPPKKGQLQCQLAELAAGDYRHPLTGEPLRLGVSTIERWYYTALGAADPIEALKRKVRSNHGEHPSVTTEAAELLAAQYRQHPSWSYQLHADNLVASMEQRPGAGEPPSYASVVRFMKNHGLIKRPRRGPPHSPGAQAAEHRYHAREVRSYESEYVNALWHLDFHHGSRRVLLPGGQWAWPILLAVLDDRSRLCCHAQWYLAESAQELCHGLSQAFQKRTLPRSILFDNGSAMIAAETVQGLSRLSVLSCNTLPYSPYQNGKQEVFFAQIEGRLLPMLEGLPELSLRSLNEATQAWAELEYNRKKHSETGESPLHRFLHDKDVGRPCPPSEALQQAFTAEITRAQRRSDGTLSVEGIRYEVPSRYGHLPRLAVRHAAWERSSVYLCDTKTGAILGRLLPQDKTKNAGRARARRRPATAESAHPPQPPSEMAPLLQKLIAQYAATGLPPAYLPKDEIEPNQPENDQSNSK